MSAGPPTAAPSKAWWFQKWTNLIPPALVVVILGGIGLTTLLSRPSAEENRVAQREGGREAAMEMAAAIEAAQAPPTTQVPARPPYYDFLTCEGFTEGQTCEPVFAYPLTPEAKSLIGFEPNTAGLINMERGRSVFVQWRNFHGVNECDVSIGIEPRPSLAGQPPVADRKLYPTKVAGKASLLDCTPTAATATGGLPTRPGSQ